MKSTKTLKKKITLRILLALVVAFLIWIVWGNLTIGTTYYEIQSEELPEAFAGYKIVQISDLHNAEFGKDNLRLVEIIKKEKPDMIAITGDLIDSSHTDLDLAIKFIQQIVEIAPCYFVTGNHEAWLGKTYPELEQQLLKLGVIVLRDQVIKLEKDETSIQLIGLDDPDFTDQDSEIQESMLETKLNNLHLQDGFKLLLSHRPEIFNAYVSTGMNLVLSGHAHGGQFRIPFVGGVIAPNQGVFPSYDAGVFHEGQTTMIVSRGIGNSIIPIRINNRPEVVIVELHSQKPEEDATQ